MYTRHAVCNRHSRPDGVPKLDLLHLVESDSDTPTNQRPIFNLPAHMCFETEDDIQVRTWHNGREQVMN
jgi:hypothetical protein